jgi:filamentous hemagglutinin
VAGTLDNRGGSLLSLGTGASSVKASALDNGAGGTLAGNGDLIVTATTLDNSKGLVQQAGTGSAAGRYAAWQRRAPAQQRCAGAVRRRAGREWRYDVGAACRSRPMHCATARARSLRRVSQALALDVRDALDNQGGQIVGNGGLRIDAGRIDNQKGTLQSAGTQGVALTVRDTLDNSGGGISGNGQVQLQVGSLVNQGGKVLAAGSGALQVQARERWTTATAAAWPVPVICGCRRHGWTTAAVQSNTPAAALQIRADSLQGAAAASSASRRWSLRAATCCWGPAALPRPSALPSMRSAWTTAATSARPAATRCGCTWRRAWTTVAARSPATARWMCRPAN